MLLRKLLRDIRLHKSQFFSIFIMTWIGIGVYVGIHSAWYGMQESAASFYAQQQLADVWIQSSDVETIAEDVIKQGFVVQTQQRFIVDASLDDKRTLRLNYIENNDVSKLQIIEGKSFDKNSAGMYVNEEFAKTHNLKIGDTITFTFSNFKDSQTIIGLIRHPEYVYFEPETTLFSGSDENFGIAFLSANQKPQGVPFTSMALHVNIDPQAAIETLKNVIQDERVYVHGRSELVSYRMYQDQIEQLKQMSYIFPVIFLAIAIMSTMSAMVRIVSKQRTQIGILKALGFKNRKIAIHYMSYVLWITVVAAILAYFAGPLLVGNLILFIAIHSYSIPNLKAMADFNAILVSILSVSIVLLVTYLTCRRELKEVIADSLKIKSPKVKKLSKLEQTHFWHRLSFYTKWNTRDILRNKARTLMGIFGSAGTCMLLVCALGLYFSMNHVSVAVYEQTIRAKTRVNIHDSASDKQIETLQKQYNGQLVLETYIEIKSDTHSMKGLLQVQDEGNLIQLPIVEADTTIKDGVMISQKMAQLLDVSLHDSVYFKLFGDKEFKQATITGIYYTPLRQGITMSKATFEAKYDRIFKANVMLTKVNMSEIYTKDGVASLRSTKQLKQDMDKNLESMDGIIVIMVLASIFLCVVVMYNLGVLALNEKTRELASLRVLGFRNKMVAKLFKKQNLWITVLGMVIGTPFGLILLNSILASMQDDIDMQAIMPIYAYLAIYFKMIALTWLMNMIFARRVNQVDMVESLKGIE